MLGPIGKLAVGFAGRCCLLCLVNEVKAARLLDAAGIQCDVKMTCFARLLRSFEAQAEDCQHCYAYCICVSSQAGRLNQIAEI
jgi:hypothetical protein